MVEELDRRLIQELQRSGRQIYVNLRYLKSPTKLSQAAPGSPDDLCSYLPTSFLAMLAT
ncbi:MAG: hypothetical protein DDT27_01434 [Dehalococcoidia bacterium]|nr:hypothetical protein [Chloroflexota bacterium]MBT9162869.1 hypothetical protein [Chloroflexota bacterium]